ncbi:MAG TPA: hypothetical protein VKG65_00740, partial [Terriglobales bacterium]|nr:hypothetical protein [Terriglobales bacterium]
TFHRDDAQSGRALRKVLILTCVFLLTIFFINSIQRSNCDDVMSQCSMKNGRENRNHGNEEESEKGCQEEKEITSL